MIIKIGDKEFNFDGYANINEIAKAFDEAQNKAYQQGRADAIDEFANKLIDELHYNVSAKPITINTPYATPIMIDGEIQKIAEQLKEQI